MLLCFCFRCSEASVSASLCGSCLKTIKSQSKHGIWAKRQQRWVVKETCRLLELGQFVRCLNVYSVQWTVCIYTLCLLLSQQTPTPTTLTADLQKMMKMMSAVKSNVWACRHQFYYQVSCCHGDQPGLCERERERESVDASQMDLFPPSVPAEYQIPKHTHIHTELWLWSHDLIGLTLK